MSSRSQIYIYIETVTTTQIWRGHVGWAVVLLGILKARRRVALPVRAITGSIAKDVIHDSNIFENPKAPWP
jgi:hypothetical protein